MRASGFPRALRFRVAGGLARLAGWLSRDARPEPEPETRAAAIPSVVVDMAPPRHWREMAEPSPPAHWMERVREAAPHLLTSQSFPVLPRFEAPAAREADADPRPTAPAPWFPSPAEAAEQPPFRKDETVRSSKAAAVHWRRRPVVPRGVRQIIFPPAAPVAAQRPPEFVERAAGRAAPAQPRWQSVRVPSQTQPEYPGPWSADGMANPSPEWPRLRKAETAPIELPEPAPAIAPPPLEYVRSRGAEAAPVSWPSAFESSVGEPALLPEKVEPNPWPELPPQRSGSGRDDAAAARRREHRERLTREQQGL